MNTSVTLRLSETDAAYATYGLRYLDGLSADTGRVLVRLINASWLEGVTVTLEQLDLIGKSITSERANVGTINKMFGIHDPAKFQGGLCLVSSSVLLTLSPEDLECARAGMSTAPRIGAVGRIWRRLSEGMSQMCGMEDAMAVSMAIAEGRRLRNHSDTSALSQDALQPLNDCIAPRL